MVQKIWDFKYSVTDFIDLKRLGLIYILCLKMIKITLKKLLIWIDLRNKYYLLKLKK